MTRLLTTPRSYIYLLPVVLMSMLVSGCASMNQLEQTRRAIKQSKFELTRVDARIKLEAPRMGPNGINPGKVDIGFKLNIVAHNRFGKDLPLNRLDIKLFANNELVATATTRKYVVLSHQQPTTISAFVAVEPEAATRNLVKRLQGKNLQYHVDGVFYFKVGQLEIPISMTLQKA